MGMQNMKIVYNIIVQPLIQTHKILLFCIDFEECFVKNQAVSSKN